MPSKTGREEAHVVHKFGKPSTKILPWWNCFVSYAANRMITLKWIILSRSLDVFRESGGTDYMKHVTQMPCLQVQGLKTLLDFQAWRRDFFNLLECMLSSGNKDYMSKDHLRIGKCSARCAFSPSSQPTFRGTEGTKGYEIWNDDCDFSLDRNLSLILNFPIILKARDPDPQRPA